MSINDHLMQSLASNFGMFKATIADLTDAELLQRPVPAANHAAWQIGHLLHAEAMMMGSFGAKMPELPAGISEAYGHNGAKSDDPAKFLPKAKILALFEQVRAGTIGWVKTATPEQFELPSPESLRQIAPTAVDMVGLAMGHMAMHVGQIQVLRRKLGKPNLF
jgi:hypothetical protein